MVRSSGTFSVGRPTRLPPRCWRRIRVLPDDIPAHPHAVAMEVAGLAPRVEVSIYPWKETPEQQHEALRQVRAFLRAYAPVDAAARGQSVAV